MPAASERRPRGPSEGTGSGTSPTTNCPPLVTAARMARPPPPDIAAARVIRRYVCPVSFTHDICGAPVRGTGGAGHRGRPAPRHRACHRPGPGPGRCRRGLPRHRPALRRRALPRHGERRRPERRSPRSSPGPRCGRPPFRPTSPTRRRWRPRLPGASEELGTVTLVANVAGGQRRRASAWAPCSACRPTSSAVCSTSIVVGTWLVSKACATRMVAAGVGGRICNVSSQAGKRAFPFLGAYCAAKAGVILLTQTMATRARPAAASVSTPSARARSTPISSTRTPCSRA